MFADAIYIGNRLTGGCRNVCFREDISIDRRSDFGRLRHEAGVSLKRAQEILGHTSEPTTLAVFTHRRMHDDSAGKIAILAGLATAAKIPGNKLETSGSKKAP
jgi:hypothetical protein